MWIDYIINAGVAVRQAQGGTPEETQAQRLAVGRRRTPPPTQKWKYDFLVQFLSGPLWKTSILDFVDYHCVVFDSEEENKFEYTTIHNVRPNPLRSSRNSSPASSTA